jgi:Na+/melibiose symporter-like transporter
MNRDWRLLLTASTASTLGDGALLAALPLLAASFTTDPRLIAGVTAWGTLPWLLASLPAGALIDRGDPKRALVRVQLAQTGLVGGLGALTVLHAQNMAVIYGIAFALGLAETFAKVAVQKLIPAVVPADGLEKANGYQNASIFTVRQFLGPPLGAGLFVLAAALPFWLSAGAFALAMVLNARLVVVRAKPVHSGRHLFHEIAEGVRWLAGQRLLRTLAVLSAFANLANFMAMGTLVLFAHQRLGLGGFGYGVLVGAMAVGGIAGSLASPAIVKRFGGRATVTTIIFTTPLAMLGIGGLAHDMVSMLALSFVTSAGAALWNVASGSLRQRTVPSGLLGRVSSAGLMMAWGAQPIGAILGGLIAATPMGLGGPWVVAGLVRLAVAVAALPALKNWPAAEGVRQEGEARASTTV